MHLIAQDLRYGARRLSKAPVFSVLALLALALGMGATTAIFSVVYAVLLKPLPFRAPERLLVIWEKNPAQNRYKLYVAPVNFLEWRRESREMEGMTAFQDIRITLTGGPGGHFDPEELNCQRVTADFLPLLGVQPVAGRAFRAEEDQPGHTNFVLLSHSLWQRRFGGDRTIPGKAIRLRNQTYTVVGVLPPGFSMMTRDVDLWIPLGLTSNDPRSSSSRFLIVIGRLRAGTSQDRARAEMETVGSRLEQAYPALNKGWRPSLFGFESELTGNVRQALWVLLAAVGFLLLMACVNVANLLLAQGADRRKEIAVRTALGAGRGRIVTQLLAESMMLSLSGGILGMLLAGAGVRLMARLGESSIPRLGEAHLDGNLFLFALSVSLATGILFGIAPAWQISSASPNAALSEGGRGGTIGRSGRILRNSLVVGEVALAVLVLIGAGLLVRSFFRLRSVNPGFQPSGLLTMRVPFMGGRNSAPDGRVAFIQQVLARVAVLPGVQSAGGINGLPLTGLGVGSLFALDGRPVPTPEQRPMGLLRSVTPGYFRTMGIPLIAGRLITDADVKSSAPVILVNQTLVRRFWPQGNPLGGRLVLDTDSRTAQVVGVVGDVKPDRVEGEDWPTIYDPYAQAPVQSLNLVVRTSHAPLSLASAVEREVHRMDPDQAVANVRSMDTVVDEAIAGARFNTVLLGIFAVIAFTLAAVGIYGVVSYEVNRRTHELGIRLALGAQQGDVLRLVVGQGARLAAIGIGVGLAAAYALTRLMSSMLFGVKPTDLYTFAAIPVMLGAVALAASYLPARRVMALNPVTALRHE
jgi:putative ABC transport system permease protein